MDNLAYNLEKVLQLKSGIKRLTLSDYRNYQSLRIETDIAPVVVFGENGAGKTNILEAISFLSPGRGMRGTKLSDIKRFIPQITDTDKMSFITPLNWAVAAEIVNNGDEHSLATAVEKAMKEPEYTDEERSFERRIVKIKNSK